MSINAFIAQGHGRSTDGRSNPYAAGWEVTDASLQARFLICISIADNCLLSILKNLLNIVYLGQV